MIIDQPCVSCGIRLEKGAMAISVVDIVSVYITTWFLCIIGNLKLFNKLDQGNVEHYNWIHTSNNISYSTNYTGN